MKKVLVDYRISDEERYNLEKLCFEVLIVPPNKILYEAVSGHPDILLHIVNDKTIIVHKDMDIKFINLLKSYNIEVFLSEKKLETNYPFNIILNALNLNDIFIHNIRYTDNKLINLVQNKKIKNVKQGYTKCSTAIVSSSAVMTSDKGIAKCLMEEYIDVLLLPPGDILLPGLNYGFIGGCCGLLENGLLAFYGSLENYAYSKEVFEFLKKHKVEPVFLSNGKLIDRGSIYIIK
ncbi:hypothetical protein M2651_13315 [Clostridium sp. SYSU_GA19001]|uniref:DUF6873 family GME fold protein n=1 Tax=Clostridium caldaquaticum TaxID=2940653 RepID=UPI00207712CD|nr:hypothetical protein [Clostridium caldaquaticum]MCM8711979.1 hypothetical protein [Clostridium caldaquaticum]